MTIRILFRFHKNYEVCIQNLTIIKSLNPDIKIDGLYGGEDKIEDIPNSLKSLFDTLWTIPLDDPYYKWKNADLCVRWWYKEQGKALDFSHIIIWEWDLLALKPFEEIYPILKPDHNYATIFGDYKYAKEIDWHWISQTYFYDLECMEDSFKKKGYKFNLETLSFGLMGGTVLCRKFLENYIREHVSSYSNDELRLSVYSQAYHIPFLDNGIRSTPNNLLDANGKLFGEKEINEVLKDGGKVIHPIRELITNLEQKISTKKDKPEDNQ
ncbi:MAG: hypothetical protein KDJ50_08630 [Alphaproteobacteria bacterium]|nr:hypothetical protein [Alphaproteobacteria bacterium]